MMDLEATLHRIENATIALWAKRDDQDCIPWASGVLLKDKVANYLISTSHTYSMNENGLVSIGYFIGKNFYYLNETRYLLPDSNIGVCDLSILKLSDNTIRNLENSGYSFIDETQVITCFNINEGQYLFACGYPTSKVERLYHKDGTRVVVEVVNDEDLSIETIDCVFENRIVNLMLPYNNDDRLYKKLKFEKGTHILLDWHGKKLRDADGRKISLQYPNGMSGCGLWMITESFDYYLTGIMVSFFKTSSVMQATFIGYIADFMRNVLQSTIPQSESVKAKWKLQR